jgi:hypothetical protein
MEPKLNEKLIYTVCTVLNNNKLLELNRKIKENYYLPYNKVTYISEEEYETLRDNFLENIKINYTQLIDKNMSKIFLENQLNLLTKNEIKGWCINTAIIINNSIRPFIDYLPNLRNMPNNWSIVNQLGSIISSILFYGSEFRNNGLIEKVRMFKCPKCNEISKEIFLPEFCHTYRCNICIDKFDRDMHQEYLKYNGLF